MVFFYCSMEVVHATECWDLAGWERASFGVFVHVHHFFCHFTVGGGQSCELSHWNLICLLFLLKKKKGDLDLPGLGTTGINTLSTQKVAHRWRRSSLSLAFEQTFTHSTAAGSQAFWQHSQHQYTITVVKHVRWKKIAMKPKWSCYMPRVDRWTDLNLSLSVPSRASWDRWLKKTQLKRDYCRHPLTVHSQLQVSPDWLNKSFIHIIQCVDPQKGVGKRWLDDEENGVVTIFIEERAWLSLWSKS